MKGSKIQLNLTNLRMKFSKENIIIKLGHYNKQYKESINQNFNIKLKVKKYFHIKFL